MLAPAKINLCLFLGGTRADGRHELVSVMQSLAWGDTVTMEPAAADEVVCPGVDGPNLAAAALAAVGGRPPLRLLIDKRIPVAAGLGGGSADAAAALRIAGRASGLSEDDLFALAAELGADVPAQVRPGRSLAAGAGERLEHLPRAPRFGVVVVPSVHRLSTADVYREADRLELSHAPADLAARLGEVRAGIGEGPYGLSEELLLNDLEPAALHLCPAIASELDRVRAAGAAHAMVSGSGPTVLGLFPDPAAAERAAADLGPGAVATTPL
ncbi:MAG: 4-(cytidine 5-diphospho)-2-C-methyl-D-erythritol kinase [Solirubrobacterales bacterium]|nr:4-(cytidine 5-diphospho)-2-C-methyl-D-erythritol kinase [Solirubrobacterales bacterium]